MQLVRCAQPSLDWSLIRNYEYVLLLLQSLSQRHLAPVITSSYYYDVARLVCSSEQLSLPRMLLKKAATPTSCSYD